MRFEEMSPAIISNTIAYSDNFIMLIGGIVNIYDNLTLEDCEAIIATKAIKQIQFAGGPEITKNTYLLINDHLLTQKPQPRLNFGGYTDLECLAFLRNAKALRVDIFKDNQLALVNKYLALDSLAISGIGISIAQVVQQVKLKELFVGEKLKALETIGKLKKLEQLTFSKVTLKNLNFLTSLKNLKALSFMLGSATDYGKLGEIGKIEKLSFMRVRLLKHEHLLPINQMKHLKELSFESQPHLLDLDWLKLKDVNVKTMACTNFNLSE